MCGIAGFLDPTASTPADELHATGREMAARIACRGPDDAGTWVDRAAGIALAHRRLSILDRSREGHQPMLSADGRLVLVYNGEIYNFGTLRAELESRSHRFRGHSDTEVLLAAIAEWGLHAALVRANGMFAGALWDRSERKLQLFRDRFGEKPLFYGWSNGLFLFGSELKALRGNPRFRGEVDRGALALFLKHGYVPAPCCIYRGLSKVTPGTISSISLTRPGQVETVSYWSARDVILAGQIAPFRGDEREAIAELHRLLLESVRLRMVSDVPLGAFLSGGIDSSTIVALMQTQSRQRVKTFTIGFERQEYDEAPHARAVAAHLGTEHTELAVTGADTLPVVSMIPDIYDEPFSDSSQIPAFLLAKLARRSVTVGLTGDGGDEIFAGYKRYLLGHAIWRMLHRIPHPARRAGARALEALPVAAWVVLERGLRRTVGLRPRTAADALASAVGFLRARDESAVYQRLMMPRGDAAGQRLAAPEPDTMASHEAPGSLRFVEKMMLWDTVSYLPDDILTKVDRATMKVSLEARTPLLDHRVFEHAWRLPLQMKLRRGVTKWPLRRILGEYLPRSLIGCQKKGFAVPLAEWLRGPLRPWMRDLLASDRLKAQRLLDPEYYAAAMDEHLSGTRDRRVELWNAMVFQAWFDSQRKVDRGARTSPSVPSGTALRES